MQTKKAEINKKLLALILGITGIVLILLITWGVKQPQNAPSQNVAGESDTQSADIIYYYGQECPHCKTVEKFIADNKIDEKVVFAKKEVWHNTANSAELEMKAKECALNPDKVGVPFLYARSKCYVGEVDVRNFLKKEAGIQ